MKLFFILVSAKNSPVLAQILNVNETFFFFHFSFTITMLFFVAGLGKDLQFLSTSKIVILHNLPSIFGD